MRFQKKLIAMTIIIVLFLTSALPVYAETISATSSAIKIQFNGKNYTLNPSPKLLKDGNILVPLRPLCTALKVKSQWINHELYIERNGVKNKVPVGNKYQVIKGTLYVPISTLSQPLNCEVSYDSANKTVILIDYQYFLDQLKTKASTFNDYLTHQYDPVNTADFKENLDFGFKLTSYSESTETASSLPQSYDVKGNANITGKMSENSASCSGVIQLNGIENTPLYETLGNKNNITFDLIASDKNFYFKSNLLEKEIGNKWLQGDFAMLEQDGINSFHDLKEQSQTKSFGSDSLAAIDSMEGSADITTFSEINSYFSATIFLIDNSHFTYTNVGNETIYTWKLDKYDLIKLVANISKLSSDTKNASLSEVLEAKEILDALEFDTTMTIKINNNIPTSNTFSYNLKLDIPEVILLEMKMSGQTELTNINTAIPEITPPSASEVLDMNDENVSQSLKTLVK